MGRTDEICRQMHGLVPDPSGKPVIGSDVMKPNRGANRRRNEHLDLARQRCGGSSARISLGVYLVSIYG
jgi:hypothetical protein